MRGDPVKSDILKVPKRLKAVTLWVHPEGRVRGSLFLREHSPDHAGPEQPIEVLNQCNPFVVIQRDEPEEVRFYNMRSIIRVEYAVQDDDIRVEGPGMQCSLQMMDGALIHGTIHEQLPPERARLLDYLNRSDECFIKVYLDDGLIFLVNKAYIIHVHVAGEHAD